MLEKIDVYDGLADWFGNLFGVVDRAIFQMLPTDEEQRRIAHDFLVRDAGVLAEGTDHGPSVYRPATMILCALQKVLGKKLDANDWGRAVENVREVRRRIAEAGRTGAFAAMFLNPVEVFHNEFLNTLKNAGVVPEQKGLSKEEDRQESQRQAFRLWGPRYIVVAALEYYLANRPEDDQSIAESEGLLWVGRLVGRLVANV